MVNTINILVNKWCYSFQEFVSSLPETPHKLPPNTACTRLVGVCAFLGTFLGFEWVPSKWQHLVPPTSG